MDANQRNAIIETRLKGQPFIARAEEWELYLSRQGNYLIRYHASGGTYFLAVASQTGEITDMTMTTPTDAGDIGIALLVFMKAGLPEMSRKVRGRYNPQ
jgi:hypothetical protein